MLEPLLWGIIPALILIVIIFQAARLRRLRARLDHAETVAHKLRGELTRLGCEVEVYDAPTTEVLVRWPDGLAAQIFVSGSAAEMAAGHKKDWREPC